MKKFQQRKAWNRRFFFVFFCFLFELNSTCGQRTTTTTTTRRRRQQRLKSRYDSGGTDAVCWTGLSYLSTNNNQDNTTTTTTINSSSFEPSTTESDDVALEFYNLENNPLRHRANNTGNNTMNNEENTTSSMPTDNIVPVESLYSCPPGIQLDVQPPPEFQQQGNSSATIPLTFKSYNYTVTGNINGDFEKILRLIKHLQDDQQSSSTDDERSLIESTNSSSPVTRIALKLTFCPLEELGYCSPLEETLFMEEEEKENDQSNATATTTKSTMSSRIESPYVIVRLDQDEGNNNETQRYDFTANIPVIVPREGGYSVLATMFFFLPTNNSNTATSSFEEEEEKRFLLVANLPTTQQYRVVRFWNEPMLPRVTVPVRLTAYILSGICVLVMLFLLHNTIRHRNNQVLQLTQGSFLSAMLIAGIIASSFSFTFEPSPLNCRLTGPLVILPLHIMYAISAGRLWRINAVISPLLLLTLEKKKDTLHQRMVKGIQHLVMCSRDNKIRRQVTGQHLARVILLFALPQIILQVAIFVTKPNTLFVDMSPGDSTGIWQCGKEGLFRSALEAVSLAFLALILLVVLIMAGSSRDLPSLFNETQVLFEVTLLSVVIMGIALFVVLSGRSNQDPNVGYMVLVFAVGALTVCTSVKIILPKLYRVWSGEVVFVSKLLAAHNREKRASAAGKQGPLATYADYSLPIADKRGGYCKMDSEQGNSINSINNNGIDKSKPRSNIGTASEMSLCESSGEMMQQGGDRVKRDVSNAEGDFDDSNKLFDFSMSSIEEQQQPHSRPSLILGMSMKGFLGGGVSPRSQEQQQQHQNHHPRQPAPSSGASIASQLRVPKQDEIVKISEDQPPPRLLLLRMLDLQHHLQHMNKTILSGNPLSIQDWEGLRRSTNVFGQIMSENVRFAWERSRAWENDMDIDDMLEEEVDYHHHPPPQLDRLETIEDEGDFSHSGASGSTRGNLKHIAVLLKRNLEVKDRRHNFTTYENCFIASEAVDFLVSSRVAQSRSHAVLIGKKLANNFHLIEHVNNDHVFSDDHVFFRFTSLFDFGNTALTDVIRDCEELSGGGSNSNSVKQALPPSDWWETPQESNLHINLAKIAVAIRSNVAVSDRWYRMMTYKSCFVASHVVDYLVASRIALSREHAVEVGRMVNDKFHIWEHVANEHEFKDAFLFFRFIDSSGNIDDNDKNNNNNNELSKSIHSVDINGSAMSVISDLDASVGMSLGTANSKTYTWLTLTDEGLASIAHQMRNEVEVKDRTYRMKVYDHCFVGSEAVDFLVGCGHAFSRKDAVLLAKAMNKKFNLYQHVMGDHELKDEFLFYRFNDDDATSLPPQASDGDRATTSEVEEEGQTGPIYGPIRRLSRKSSERWKNLNDCDLARIATSLKHGVPVRDRRYHLVLFRKCFVGRQAVDFLINSGYAKSRKDATELATALMTKFGIFEHVTQEHEFSDGYRFYRFVEGNEVFINTLQSLPRMSLLSRQSSFTNLAPKFEFKQSSAKRIVTLDLSRSTNSGNSRNSGNSNSDKLFTQIDEASQESGSGKSAQEENDEQNKHFQLLPRVVEIRSVSSDATREI